MPEGRAGAWRSSIAQRAAWNLGTSLAGEPSDTVVINGVVPTSHSAPGTVNHAERLLRMGAAMHAGQMADALERCLEQPLRYAADRRQFGRPIAKFQAVQHSLAVLAGEMAAATTSADAAVSAISRHGIEDERTFLAVATAKVRGGPGGGRWRRHRPSGAWRDELHPQGQPSASHPATMGVARRVRPETVWAIELGRHIEKE